MPHEIQLYVVVALENMFKQSFYNRSCGCRIGLVNFFINELKNYQNNSHFHVDVISKWKFILKPMSFSSFIIKRILTNNICFSYYPFFLVTFIRILEVLGRHSIAAPDLKSLLNLLYSKTEIYNEVNLATFRFCFS